jgi:hypothetical protein
MHGPLCFQRGNHERVIIPEASIRHSLAELGEILRHRPDLVLQGVPLPLVEIAASHTGTIGDGNRGRYVAFMPATIFYARRGRIAGMKFGTYSLRTLLAVMAGCAFIGFVTNWLLAMGLGARVIVVIPWGLGSLLGIYFADRYKRSTLVGAMIGGMVGHMIFPGSIIVYLYLNQMNGVRSLLENVWMPLLLAACGSGLLAAIIDIFRTGITLRRA